MDQNKDTIAVHADRTEYETAWNHLTQSEQIDIYKEAMYLISRGYVDGELDDVAAKLAYVRRKQDGSEVSS